MCLFEGVVSFDQRRKPAGALLEGDLTLADLLEFLVVLHTDGIDLRTQNVGEI